MKSDAKLFLESGLLEEYLLGLADDDQVEMIERYIREYPEVRAEYEAMQKAMKQFARDQGVTTPTRDAIIKNVVRKPGGAAKPSGPTRWAWAAGLAALVFASAAIFFWNRAGIFENENRRRGAEFEQLSQAMQAQTEQCRALENRFKLLSDPNTAKLILQGNQKAPDFQVVAYWNETQQQCCVSLTALPMLPDRRCFQIWADVDGEMVNLGVLPMTIGEMVSIPHKINAASLNITIEPEGGSEHPTVAELVASVAI